MSEEQFQMSDAVEEGVDHTPPTVNKEQGGGKTSMKQAEIDETRKRSEKQEDIQEIAQRNTKTKVLNDEEIVQDGKAKYEDTDDMVEKNPDGVQITEEKIGKSNDESARYRKLVAELNRQVQEHQEQRRQDITALRLQAVEEEKRYLILQQDLRKCRTQLASSSGNAAALKREKKKLMDDLVQVTHEFKVLREEKDEWKRKYTEMEIVASTLRQGQVEPFPILETNQSVSDSSSHDQHRAEFEKYRQELVGQLQHEIITVK